MKRKKFFELENIELQLLRSTMCLGFVALNVSPLFAYAESKVESNQFAGKLESQLHYQQLQTDVLKQQIKNLNQGEEKSEEVSLDIAGFFEVIAYTTDNSESSPLTLAVESYK
jgi:cell division protein FtsB